MSDHVNSSWQLQQLLVATNFYPISRSSPPEVFLGKVLWKYATNLQGNTHVKA